MDVDGLLFGIRIDSKGQPHAVTSNDVTSATPTPGLLWLHLDADSEAAVRWIREESGIDPITQDALLAEETRPRTIAEGDALLLILRGVNLTPGEDPDDMVSLRMLIGPDRVLTLRRRPVRTVEDARTDLEAGRVEGTSGDLLVAICDRLTHYVGEVVGSLEDRADELEDQMLSAGSRALRAKLGDLRRTLIALRRYLAPQREALARVSAERMTWTDDRHRARLREITDRSIRHVEELDAVRERLAVASDELSGRLTERVEQRMYLLSIVTAIFLPLAFVTGLLGINVGGIPGSEAPSAFMVVAGGCSVVALLMAIVLKRRGWL